MVYLTLQAIHFITSYKSTSTGDDNTAWSFVVVMFAGVILTVFGKKKKRMTEIFRPAYSCSNQSAIS
ncbi:LPXTG cell wall anchor domain-containing protein [[Eubacterium] rectale]|uniref:LPXTG cell wall anchor domain-containing protein n=1 Tax=Agathobacter rectalis TaxID=39491 RepID=A0A395UZI7_9FIRM|nr:LPXTG cell wall anchor domain-containing protein [Agathobacter rectalis]RGK40174.1 LPXTG cell wall anchor domain-containing protein [Agathobacter rectalis]RGM41666.1 LPXTG cell wall anchor domain-containing protein [Agathobacter rectalis]RGM66360.1 LPXTG cell wall anchor domain-containing protein [Agathobacter rectalis]RGR52362.1 LPXTG cell wall anchor domain-containing protein [Agathobacter rectalis]